MRLALCLEYPLQQRGGVEALVRALIDGLADRHELYLVSPDDSAGIDRRLRGHFQWKSSAPWYAQTERLVAWARDHRIEVFHFHMGGTYNWNARSWSGCPITRVAAAGFRCLTTNHQAISPFDANRATEPLARRLGSFVRRWPGKARQLAAVEREYLVSRHDLRIARAGFPGFRPKLGQIYHSLLDADQDSAPHAGEGRVILNLATVARRKGQHILAEAFARIAGEFPEWSLRLVGYHADDGCVEIIRRIAADHGLEERIHLPGATDDPRSAIAGAAIYVQPSLLEGLGLSLQEAQFHRRACIGTRVGGIPELIEDGVSGLLVPPADPGAMAVALRRLISDPTLRRTFGEAGRRHVLDSGMTREGMIQTHLDIYQSIG